MTDLMRLNTNYETMLSIVRNREDGRRFVPLVLRLEAEMRRIEDQTSAYDRILNG